MYIYYEVSEDIEAAISRENQIKSGSRQKKIDLINNFNRQWKDLYECLWDCFVAGAAPRNDNWGVIISLTPMGQGGLLK